MLEFGQTRGSWDFGRGAPARHLPQLCPGGWVPSPTHLPFAACLGRFVAVL